MLRRSAIWEAAAFQPRSGAREADVRYSEALMIASPFCP